MATKGRKEELKSGHEQDAVSRYWRSCYNWGPGALKRVKRALNKRVRRVSNAEVRNELLAP